MTRSLKKGPFVDERILEKMKNLKPSDRVVIKTWTRDCAITPEMVGFTFGVHNGRQHIAVTVVEEMIGHKLGEFAPTTKFVRHGGRMQRESEQKEAEKETAQVQAEKTAAEPAKPAAKK